MKPLKLKLNNIGPFYGEHTLDFSELGEMYLICGKMGSGKTTIFDAMTYALYGKLPGSRSNIGPKALFSDFASPEDSCQVDFSFEVKGEKYRVVRNPPKNQEKKTSQDGKVSLYKITKDNQENFINDKKTEVENYIVSLIGLTEDEFSRIVLLPQGEFAAFLKQKSSEKQKTLAKLFPSEYYSKIIEKVKKENEEIASEKKLLNRQLESITEDFNPQTYEEDIKSEKKLLSTLTLETENREKKLIDLEKDFFEKNQEITKIKKTLSNKEDLKNLLSEETLILEKKDKIARGEKAQNILPLLNSKNQSENQFNQLILELEETKNQLKNAEIDFNNAEKDHFQVKELSETLEKEKITEEKLKSADEKFKTLEKSREKFENLLSVEKKLESEKSEILPKITEIESNIKSINQKTENYVALLEEKNLSKEALEKFTELQNLYFENQDYLEKSKELTREILETEKLLLSNEELLEEYKNQFEESKNQNLAFILAEKLAENEPCPVCGSLHHPNIVKSSVDFKPLEEKIQIQEKNLEAQKKLLESQKNQQSQNEALEKSTSKKIEEKLSDSILIFTKNSSLIKNNPSVNFGDVENIKTLLSKNEIKIFEENKVAIENELEKMNKLIQDKEISEKKLIEFQSQLNEILEKLPETKTSLEVEKTRIQSLEEELSNINLGKKIDIKVVSKDFFAKEYDLCKNTVLELEEKIDNFQKRYNGAKSTYEKLISSTEILEKQKETRKSEKETAEKSFLESLEKSDFASEEDILNSVIDNRLLLELKNSVENWQLKINSLKTLLSEEKDYSEKDLERAENQIAELSKSKETLETEKSDFKEKLQNQSVKVATLENAKIEYDKNLAKQQEVFEKAEVYEKLCKALSGDNPKKTPFDAWYLGIFLEEITFYASRRLKNMTENRYSLRLGDASNNRGFKGLDLEIVDSHTKKARSVDSLSGGETFLASLSLALALTDTVQSKKGGIQLDSLFIDEGFGSLDETALERALQTLDEVRENRSVGIISHVSELKQRDFNRVEVDKTTVGSSIRVKILG